MTPWTEGKPLYEPTTAGGNLLHDTSGNVSMDSSVCSRLWRRPGPSIVVARSPAFGDTLLLLSFGAACFINFSRNRTLHCGLTGPLFAVAGVAAALIERGVWHFDMRVVWGLVLLGVGIAFLLEWRTAGQPNGPDACNAGRR
jgi:hypothetical protein